MHEKPAEGGGSETHHNQGDTSSNSSLRGKIRFIIERPCGSSAGKCYGKAMFCCTMVSCLSTLFQCFDDLTGLHLLWTILDIICTIVFTSELITRFTICPHKSRFFLEWLNWIDILSILSFYLEMMFERLFVIRSDSGFWEHFFRLLRIPQILLLRRYSRELWLIHKTLDNSLTMLSLLASLTFVVALIFATIVYFFEHLAQPTVFANITESLWWAMITLMTVGFGDMQPVTVMGRISGGVLMLVGTVIVRLPISLLGISCVRVFTVHRRRAGCPLSDNANIFSMSSILQLKIQQSLENLQTLDNPTPQQSPHHPVAISPDFQLGQDLPCEIIKPGIRSKFAKLRKFVWRTWENPRESTAGVCYQVMILVAVTLSTAALIIESLHQFRHRVIVNRINAVSSSVLLIDLMLRIFFLESPKKFVTDWQTVCQFVASTPFVLNRVWSLSLPSMAIFSTFRLIRVFRLCPSDISRKVTIIRVTLGQSVSIFALLLVIVGSISVVCVFATFEFETNNSKTPIFDCFYWTIQLITTVGYGDIGVTGTGSKIVGSILAIGGGIGIALPVAILSDKLTLNLESTGGIEAQARRLSRASNSTLGTRLAEFNRDMLGFHAFLISKYPDLVESQLVSNYRLHRRSKRLCLQSPLTSPAPSSSHDMGLPSNLRKMLTENFSLLIKREALRAAMSKATRHIGQQWGKDQACQQPSQKPTEPPMGRGWDRAGMNGGSNSGTSQSQGAAVSHYSRGCVSSAVVWLIDEEPDETTEKNSSTNTKDLSVSTESTIKECLDNRDEVTLRREPSQYQAPSGRYTKRGHFG
eukprot:c3542_g1_i1.p1 GENE.c3542_g1_i1~~c3542_g1_i1.p1  ORF type:complete len:811 (-),score=137.28 c3542_g1_i1:74-2506(-)